ncbi:MAG: ribosome biogenesis GTP-binding protein YihA/YsxC [Cyclonatronaceae bacterium]
MRIQKAEYLLSAPDLSVCPTDGKPEICFAGRSNVGKSSVINALTRRKKLAHTSNSPGKTRSLNYYQIDDQWYLVDMPGYGYAKISKKEQARWGREMKRYLLERQVLKLVVLLVDIRHKPSALDEEFIYWLGKHRIPFCIVLNKADKISKNRAVQRQSTLADILGDMNIEVPVFAVSAVNPVSLDELSRLLDDFIREN